MRTLLSGCFVILVSCGGGGGGGGTQNHSTTPTSATVFFDGTPNGQVGSPFVGSFRVLSSEDESYSFTLADGPQGLSVSSNGVLSWTPSQGQEGKKSVTITTTDRNGKRSDSAHMFLVEGNRLLGSATIGSAGGTLLGVGSGGDIFEVELNVPPGSIAQPVQIRVFEHVSSPESTFTGHIRFEPTDLSFSSLATLKITYLDSLLSRVRILDESRVGLFKETNDQFDPVVGSVQNASINQVRGGVSKLGDFFVSGLEASAFSSETQTLFHSMEGWVSSPGISLLATQDCHSGEGNMSFFLNHVKNLSQTRIIKFLKGTSFQPGKTNCLLIHGLFSRPEDLGELNTWAIARYDNVLSYQYPSGMPIAINSAALAFAMQNNTNIFTTYSGFDIVAHSMGGLVARCMLETLPARFAVTGHHSPQFLVTLGTPNEGGIFDLGAYASLPLLEKLIPSAVQGLSGPRDLIPGSSFLSQLNAPPSTDRGKAKYFFVAGTDVTQPNNDGAVEIQSALFPEAAPEFTYTANGICHGGLTSMFTSGGIAGAIESHVTPRAIRLQDLVVTNNRRILGPPTFSTTGQLTGYQYVDYSLDLDISNTCLGLNWPIWIRWEYGPFLSPAAEKGYFFFDPQYPALQSIPAAIFENPNHSQFITDDPMPESLQFARRTSGGIQLIGIPGSQQLPQVRAIFYVGDPSNIAKRVKIDLGVVQTQ